MHCVCRFRRLYALLRCICRAKPPPGLTCAEDKGLIGDFRKIHTPEDESRSRKFFQAAGKYFWPAFTLSFPSLSTHQNPPGRAQTIQPSRPSEAHAFAEKTIERSALFSV